MSFDFLAAQRVICVACSHQPELVACVRTKIRRYNQNHAVRRSDVIDENTEGWDKKKGNKIRGKGEVGC